MKNLLQIPMIFDDVQLGIDVRTRRQEMGLSQTQLAHMIGYKDGVSISAVETASHSDTMTVRRYMMLCNALDLNPMHYWQTDEPPINRETVESWWDSV